MFASFASFIAIAVLATPSVLANLAMTAPVASTSWPAGQQQTITWIDNGQAPSVASLGPCSVGIYVGSQITQTQLQLITDSVDVSTTSSIAFTPDPSIGPNGGDYFIRFTSISLKDPANPTYPAEAFSAKFTLSGMSGTFNSTIQAEIAAASSAAPGSSAAPAGASPAAGGSSAPSAPGSNTASTSAPSSPSASKTASQTSKSAAPSGSAVAGAANGASAVGASVGLVGSILAIASAMLL